MNSSLNKSAQCYGLYDEKGESIAFAAVIHMPHPINKKIKRVSRLVVLPDYQGVGIGTRLITEVAKIYAARGFDVSAVAASANLIQALSRHPQWGLVKIERSKPHTGSISNRWKTSNRKIASFFYKRSKGQV